MTMKFEDEDDYDEDIDEEEEEDLEEDEEEEEDDEKEEEDEDEDEEDIEQQPTSSWEVTNTSGNDGEYSLDLYNLASFNFHPLQIDADNLESELLHGTKLATQQIINR